MQERNLRGHRQAHRHADLCRSAGHAVRLLVGRVLKSPDLDERDEQLIRTLAAQVSVAIENRRLFRAAEQEREYLRSVLETMPRVLSCLTLIP